MLATILSILISVIIVLWLGKLTFVMLDLEDELDRLEEAMSICFQRIKKLEENIDDDFR